MNMIAADVATAAEKKGEQVAQEFTYLNDAVGGVINRLERRILTSKPYRLKRLPLHLNIFSNGRDIRNKIFGEIIHIHWIVNSGISINQLNELANYKKIVITLHDLNLVTGGCHTPISCSSYNEKCVNCPSANGWLATKIVAHRRKEIEKFLSAAHVCCPSEFVYNLVDTPNKYIIPNPVQIPRQPVDIEDRDIDVLFFLDRKNWFLKGYDKACKKIQEYSEIGLRIGVIGDPYHDHRYDNSIENFGFMDRNNVLRILPRAKKLYIGSRFETFSLLAHEAMKSGCEIEHDEKTAVTDLISKEHHNQANSQHSKPTSYFDLYNAVLLK